MQHFILGAAMVAWSWLIATSAAGSRFAMGAAIASTLLLHIGVCAILAFTWWRARSMAQARGWPERTAARSEKAFLLALAYAASGGTMVVATAALEGIGRVGLTAASIAFHLGAFPVGRFLISSQFRLLREYEARGVVERSP